MVSVLITEYFLSTYAPGERNKAIIAEAYGMVKAVYSALKEAGVEVVLTVSRHLTNFIGYASAVAVDESTYLGALEKLVEGVDHVIAIAPPVELVSIADIAKGKLLGPSTEVIKILSNKYETAKALRRCGLPSPETTICESGRDCDYWSLRPPLVVKPSMLAGAQCVYVVEDHARAGKIVDVVAKCDPNGYAVLQEFVSGVHGSISALYTSNTLRLFSLNLQLVGFEDGGVVYHGSVLPVRSRHLALEALKVAEGLASCLNGLNGYIGLDVVWNREGMYVVEANPRFTTSGIGIAMIYPELGRAMLNLYEPRHKYLGEEVSGYAYVVKLGRGECESLEACIDSLVCGTASSIAEAIESVHRLNPLALRHLVYDVTLAYG